MIVYILFVEVKPRNSTCVHEWGIFNILIDALVRKLCMKMLKFIGLICGLQTKLVHTSLVFLVCHDLGNICYVTRFTFLANKISIGLS